MSECVGGSRRKHVQTQRVWIRINGPRADDSISLQSPQPGRAPTTAANSREILKPLRGILLEEVDGNAQPNISQVQTSARAIFPYAGNLDC
jgi:hypothetical protein